MTNPISTTNTISKTMFKTFIGLSLFAMFIFLVACTPNMPTDGGSLPTTTTRRDAAPAGLLESEALKKFSSAAELMAFLKESSQESFGGYGRGIYSMTDDSMMAVEKSAAPQAAPSSGAVSERAGASDYSTTNIQVAGVDEADIVKNDGKYIYTVTQNKLIIVEAYPAESAEIIAQVTLTGNPRDLFVNGNKLVVLADGNTITYTIPAFDFMPREQYVQTTNAQVFDITDKKNPILLHNYSVTGYYTTSRMIENNVYLIAQEGVYYYDGVVPMPRIMESGKIIVQPDIYYFPVPRPSYTFTTVAALNLAAKESEVTAKTFMIDSASTVYVSAENIYIAHQKNVPYEPDYMQKRFYEVVVPLLPDDIQSEILEIKSGRASKAEEEWKSIQPILEQMYQTLNEKSRSELTQKIQDGLDAYEGKLDAERRKTVIHKIGIANGDSTYKAKGEVSGWLQNQFSLDEFEGNLRVATTTDVYTRTGNELYNNVFVLNSDLKIIGSLEDIAPDERIYSTRFLGEKLYMVTFKRLDPLFVIDLSDATKPKILGELKIPGFSDYLHPYDENHIIGIGRDTDANQWGGVSVKGLKLALFDVSDVNNPTQVGQYVISGSGTDSEALHDHKAFLFDKEKNLLVIPVREASERVYDSKGGYYRWNVLQGAYVFGLTSADGFTLKGVVTHQRGTEDNEYYYTGPATVRRSLFMDNVLYTISQSRIKMNNLDNVKEEIGTIELPVETPKYPPVVIYDVK